MFSFQELKELKILLNACRNNYAYIKPIVQFAPNTDMRKDEILNLTWKSVDVCKIAGVENFRFHDLRHTATTRMVGSGIPIIVLKIFWDALTFIPP